MEKALISIIVPVYNAEKMLEDCIRNILKQTYTNLEIIFVNDGSTDSSCKIICNYKKKDDRIKLINQENKGVSEARNQGLLAASGEYVLFVDSDDWIDINTCERALETIVQHDADIVMWPYVREYGKMSKRTNLFEETFIIFEGEYTKLLYRRMIAPVKEELCAPEKVDSLGTIWGKLYRRDKILENSFIDIDIIGTGEDILFNIMVSDKIKKVVYISDIFYHYRKDNLTSLTHKYKADLSEKWKDSYEIINKYLMESCRPEIYFEALSNRICLGLIGLGLNLAEDTRLSFFKKYKEMKKILNMSHYEDALKKFEINYLPLHWRVFFLFAKYKYSLCLCSLLYIMEKMRRL